MRLIHIFNGLLQVITMSFADSIIQDYRRLQEVDNQMKECFHNLFNSVIHQELGISKTQIEALGNIVIAGSTQEGAMVARSFKPCTDDTNSINKEIEFDLEFNLIEIPISYRNCIQDLNEKEGFVKVLFIEEFLSFAGHASWKVDPEEFKRYTDKVTDDNCYLKTARFKGEVLSKVIFKTREDYIQLILAAALEVDFDQISLSTPKQSITKSSVENGIQIFVDSNLELDLSWDVVTVFRITWWPEVAQEWKQRDRRWPSKDVIENVTTRGGYIITKPSDDDKNNHETSELRYSFAHVERDLISRRTTHQNLVYLIFKSMIYKWIKPLDSNQIHSFMAKTVMFWTCEKYPPEHQIWVDLDEITYLTLSYLFNELLKAFQDGILPYYFIPSINVIEKLSEDLNTKVIDQIKSILIDTKMYIPHNVNEVIDAWEERFRKIQSTHRLLDELGQKNYEVLLKRPKLIPNILEIFGPEIWKGFRKKVGREAKRVGDQIEDETNRFCKKAKKETNRIGKQVENEVKRFGNKVGKEAERVGKKVKKELKRLVRW